MARKRKVKYSRLFILIILIVLIIGLSVLALGKFNSKKTTKKVKDIMEIKEYDYTLKENATDYYKKLFKELSDTLKSKNVDEEKYSDLVAKMFVADFFNLDNKYSKNDVGGVEFVYKNYQTDFEKYAMDAIYKSVESNVYGNRKQKLPVVDSVKTEKVKNEVFKYGDSSDENAYVYNFNITYKEDLDYQTNGNLVLIHNGKKIDVASMSEKSSS